MKVLVVSSWFRSPPNNGSRIRVYNLIKALSRRHEVRLVSLLQDDSDPRDASELEDICRLVSLHESRWFKGGTLRSLAGFFSGKPRSYVDTFDPAIAQAVRRAIEEIRPDVIVGSQLPAMTYVPGDAGCPVVFEEIEIGSMLRRIRDCSGLARLRVSLTFAKHRSFVREMLGRSDGYTCVSSEELDMVKRCCVPTIEGCVIPNGVDTGHYDPGDRNPQEWTLVYNGALTFGANLDAVRHYVDQIYPLLRSRVPGVRLLVTGRTDGVDLTGISDCPGVELTGYVQDIRDVLKKSYSVCNPAARGGRFEAEDS